MEKPQPKRGRPCKHDLHVIAHYYNLLITEPDTMPTDKFIAQQLAVSPRHFRRLKKQLKDQNLLWKISEEINNTELSEEVINTAAAKIKDVMEPDSAEDEVFIDDDSPIIWMWE